MSDLFILIARRPIRTLLAGDHLSANKDLIGRAVNLRRTRFSTPIFVENSPEGLMNSEGCRPISTSLAGDRPFCQENSEGWVDKTHGVGQYGPYWLWVDNLVRRTPRVVSTKRMAPDMIDLIGRESNICSGELLGGGSTKRRMTYHPHVRSCW